MRKFQKPSISALIGLICLAVSKADPPASNTAGAPSTLPTSEATVQDGQVPSVRWSDGRVASLMINRNPPMQIPVSAEMIETTCTDASRTRCRFKVSFRQDRFAMKWTTHPDPAKVGATIEKKIYSRFQPVENQILITKDLEQFYPRATSGIDPLRIECDDYSFLPGGTRTMPPSQTAIETWENVTMSRNPETGVSENRFSGGALGVELRAASEGSLELSRVRTYTANNDIPSLLGSEHPVWFIPQSDGDFCQVSFDLNLQEALLAFQHYERNLSSTYTPYIWGSDEFSDYEDEIRGIPSSFFIYQEIIISTNNQGLTRSIRGQEREVR